MRRLSLVFLGLLRLTTVLAEPFKIPSEQIGFLESTETELREVAGKNFEPYENQRFQNNKSYWLKFSLKSNTEYGKSYLRLFLGLNDATIYMTGQDLRPVSEPIDASYFSTRTALRNTFVPLHSHQQDAYVFIHIKVFTGLSFKPNFIVLCQEDYFNLANNDSNLQFLVQGIILFVMIFSFSLFATVKKWIYLHYGFYLFCIWAILSVFNSTIEWFLPRSPYFYIFLLHFALSLVGVFYVQFLRYFFSIREKLKKIDTVLLYLIYLQVVVLVFEIATLVLVFNLGLAHRINSLNNFITFGLVLFSTLYFAKKTEKSSFYIFLGNVILILSAIFASTKTLLWQDFGTFKPYYELYVFEFGVVSEVLLFSLGLSFRYIEAEEKQKQAQHMALQTQIKLNEELEHRVQIRTEQLNELNLQLKENNLAMMETLAQVSEQAQLLDKRNQEVDASLAYARRIQNAVLPQKDDLDKILKSYFLFYRAKDTVSGDFYWLHKTEDGKIVVVVADCTGHGVPGAFMSLLGVDLLNQIVIQQQITQPNLILEALHNGIRKQLRQNENSNKDGMDVAIAVFDLKDDLLYFSGAHNNPRFRIRKFVLLGL